LFATALAFRDFQLATAPDPATGKPIRANRRFSSSITPRRAPHDGYAMQPLPSSFAKRHLLQHQCLPLLRRPRRRDRHVFPLSLVPETPFEALDKSTLANLSPDFLFEDSSSACARARYAGT